MEDIDEADDSNRLAVPFAPPKLAAPSETIKEQLNEKLSVVQLIDKLIKEEEE